MIDAQAHFSERFLERIGDNRILDGFVQFAVDRALKDERWVHQGLIWILHEKEEALVMTAAISEVKDRFCNEIMGKFSQWLWEAEGIEQCIQWLRAISGVLFNVFVNQIIIEYVWEIDYISQREREWRDPQYIVEIQINGRKYRKEVSYWKKRTQLEALGIALKERERLLEEKKEHEARKMRKTPNLKICRNLVRKWTLVEYEQGKFKLRWLSVRSSKAESTTRDVYYENDEIWVNTSRSLNKHTFCDAYNELIEHLSRKVELTPWEIQELWKFNNQFLYTQKTSQK